MTQELLQFRP